MALKRRRSSPNQSIDAARTSTYAATRGIRRIDGPTEKFGVYNLKNLVINSDRSLSLRDPILLYKDKPETVLGTVYKILYSFDSNRANDLYITSTGIYDMQGNRRAIVYLNELGKNVELNFDADIETTDTYRINANVTYANLSTSSIINNIEVNNGSGEPVSRFIRYTIVDGAPVLTVFDPATVNLGTGDLVYDPDFYSDVFQDVRDNYESQVFSVKGILQYVYYNHTTQKIVNEQANNLDVKTLLRSNASTRYTLASRVPEGTGVYLKAFVDIKKYPRTKIYCSWEETQDGIFYDTCQEFKLKFSGNLIPLKIKKDEVDVTLEPKTIYVVPFEIFSDSDNVLNRPDILFVNADNTTRRFVLYSLPSYEEVEGVEYEDLDDLQPVPANINDIRTATSSNAPNDPRPYSLALLLNAQTGSYEDNLKIDLHHYTAEATKIANDEVAKIKADLTKASVLQKNKTTNYLLNTAKWFVKAKVEYFASYPGAPSPNVRTEYWTDTSTSQIFQTGDISTFKVNYPNVPHIIKDLQIVSHVDKPNAVYPWTINTGNSGAEVVRLWKPQDIVQYQNNVVWGDFVDLNPDSTVLKDDLYNIYYTLSKQPITKENLLAASLASFTFSNINEIDQNSINATLNVDSFKISFSNRKNVYEQFSTPVVSEYYSETYNGSPVAAIDSLNTGYGQTAYVGSSLTLAKPTQAIVNKSRLNDFIVPKQEVNFSKVFNSDVYDEIGTFSGTALKNIDYLFNNPYHYYLNKLAAKQEILFRNPTPTTENHSGQTVTYGFLMLTKNTDTSPKLMIDTLLRYKDTDSAYQVQTEITIERPKLRMLYDSCYTIENESEYVYSDTDKILHYDEPSTETFYAGGNEYTYNVGTSEKTFIFKGKHIAYINRNLPNAINNLGYIDHVSLLSDVPEVETTDLGKPSEAKGLLNYRKSLYAFGNTSFKNNVLVSKTNSIQFPLSNIVDLDASQDSYIHSVVPWRDYLVAVSNNAIYLINRVEGGFLTKIVNTFTGVTEQDKDSFMSILNGLLFKNGEKLFSLSPNPNSSVDTILNINEISKPIGNLLAIDSNKVIGFTTESYYGLFISVDDKTYMLEYDYTSRDFTFMEYPVEINQVFIDSVQKIIVTDVDGKQYYFNKLLTADITDVIGYGDVLDVEYDSVDEDTEVTPINFQIDSGEKTDDLNASKNFLETRIAFGLQSEKQAIPLTVDVYTDGHKQIIHKAVETDTAFWTTDLTDLGALNTDLTVNTSEIINTLKEFRLRHTGVGKTIRHVISGNSLTNFKLYVIYYKYRYLPGEE